MWSGVGYFFFVIPLVALTPLLFPTGHLPSRRWRLPLVVGAIGLAVVVAGNIVDPTVHTDVGIVNPLGLPELEPWIGRITGVGMIPVVALAVAGLVDVLRRARRSTGIERLQMRWFAVGATAFFLAVVGLALSYEFVGIELALTVFVFGAPILPVSLTVAILRYRLYEIDRIVSRTVSYAVVTLVLVVVYAGSVVGLAAVVRSVSGGGGGGLVVAASTLVVAAAFGPVRRRIQAVVDRRFNRARYDAVQTIERFGQRLRDEVDLDLLTGDLAGVSSATLHPVHASVWLRPMTSDGAT